MLPLIPTARLLGKWTLMLKPREADPSLRPRAPQEPPSQSSGSTPHSPPLLEPSLQAGRSTTLEGHGGRGGLVTMQHSVRHSTFLQQWVHRALQSLGWVPGFKALFLHLLSLRLSQVACLCDPKRPYLYWAKHHCFYIIWLFCALNSGKCVNTWPQLSKHKRIISTKVLYWPIVL